MYRVNVNGTDYVAPDLATLQQWANEGRLLPETMVFDQLMQTSRRADQVMGLVIRSQGDYAQPTGQAPNYPRQTNQYSAGYTKVPNNLVLAIISTVCCCLPFGIASIVFAAQVDGFVARGELDKAVVASEKAKNWAIASIICGAISNVIWFAIAMAGGIN